ncbi:hypothetical protein ACLB1T_03915 [Escherichia coli]
MMSKQLAAQAPVDPIVLGKMGSSYGIRGWLQSILSAEDAKAFLTISPGLSRRQDSGSKSSWKAGSAANQDMIIELKGVDDRDAANLLTNCGICRGFIAAASA